MTSRRSFVTGAVAALTAFFTWCSDVVFGKLSKEPTNKLHDYWGCHQCRRNQNEWQVFRFNQEYGRWQEIYWEAMRPGDYVLAVMQPYRFPDPAFDLKIEVECWHIEGEPYVTKDGIKGIRIAQEVDVTKILYELCNRGQLSRFRDILRDGNYPGIDRPGPGRDAC